MSEIQRASDEFALARARALNTYADLERSLTLLFSTLLDTDIQKAFLVFSKLMNARSRRQVLSQLLQMSHGDKYTVFFKSLMKHLARVDDTRNQVVHWIQGTIRLTYQGA